MTILNLVTSDQHLISAQKIKIASGDINSVQLKVAFDSAWDSHPARTAVFYTSLNPTKHEILMTEDVCVIPSEVLEKPGFLHIGIRGVSTDGTAVKTSSIVQQKIVQGAETGETTLSPALDLYQQYLAAMDAKTDPIFTEIKAKLAEEQAAHMAEITDILNPVVLWENENPIAEFIEQTIEMDLSEFKRIGIVFVSVSAIDINYYYERVYTQKDVLYTEHEPGYSSGTSSIFARTFKISDTGIQFYNDTGTSTKNRTVIPIKITG